MEITRECPVCKQQALHIIIDRAGNVISKNCILCGSEKTEEGNG
jgi:Zn ribbon nucleic-acid-binding protein